MPKPVCDHCNDTHRVFFFNHYLGERETRRCTYCPLPCPKCSLGAYCKTTPCPCECHGPKQPEQAAETNAKLDEIKAEIDRLRAPITSCGLHELSEAELDHTDEGWVFWDSEYPEEGSCGPYESCEGAVAELKQANYTLSLESIFKLAAQLDEAKAEIERPKAGVEQREQSLTESCFPDGDRVVLESYGAPMFARIELAEKLEALAAAATEAAKELRGE